MRSRCGIAASGTTVVEIVRKLGISEKRIANRVDGLIFSASRFNVTIATCDGPPSMSFARQWLSFHEISLLRQMARTSADLQ